MTISEGMIHQVAEDFVSSALTDVRERIEKRHSNRFPLLSYGMKLMDHCYLCDKNTEEIFCIRDQYPNNGSGWMTCSECAPYVRNYFLPQYTLQHDFVLTPAGQHAIASNNMSVKFVRRSRTLVRRYPFIQHEAKVMRVMFRSKEVFGSYKSDRIAEDRILVGISWLDCTGSYQKAVHLSNVARLNASFPQTFREFLQIARNSRSIITKRLFDAIRREYLLIDAWNRIKYRLGDDIMDFYGWFSDD